MVTLRSATPRGDLLAVVAMVPGGNGCSSNSNGLTILFDGLDLHRPGRKWRRRRRGRALPVTAEPSLASWPGLAPAIPGYRRRSILFLRRPSTSASSSANVRDVGEPGAPR